MYFDAAISVDGQTLLVTEGQFGTPDNPTGNGFPKAANLVLFELSEGEFVRGIDAAILARVNTVALEYAGELSSDGLRLYFTRADPANGVSPQIFWASRDSEDAPFSAAALVPGLGDYAESPTLGGKVGDSDTGKTGRDGSSLYFHRPAPRAGADQGPSFVLYRATI